MRGSGENGEKRRGIRDLSLEMGVTDRFRLRVVKQVQSCLQI